MFFMSLPLCNSIVPNQQDNTFAGFTSTKHVDEVYITKTVITQEIFVSSNVTLSFVISYPKYDVIFKKLIVLI